MLMHTDNGGVDHLDSGIVGSGKCVYDAAPDTSPPPADETVIAGRVRTEVVRQVTPWRPRPQDPEYAIEDAAVIHSWHAARLIGQHRLDGNPFFVGEFVAHDFDPQFGSLNHGGRSKRNASGPAPVRRSRGRSGH